MLRNVILWIIWYSELTNSELTKFSSTPELLHYAFISWLKWILHCWCFLQQWEFAGVVLVCALKVNTREKLFQRILSNARSINNAAVRHKLTSSLVTWVRKCNQADGGHFEQLARVLNGESVTVHLTTYLNECTMLLLPF